MVDLPNQVINVTVQVNNAAAREGGYVVQVYFSQGLSRFSRFEKMLGGFAKVWVVARGSVQAEVPVTFAAMSYYDPIARDMVLEASDYTIFVCTSIADDCKANSHTITIPTTVTGL